MTFESDKRSFGFPCPYPVGGQNFNNRELILQLMQGFPYPFFSVGDALRYIYYTLDCRFLALINLFSRDIFLGAPLLLASKTYTINNTKKPYPSRQHQWLLGAQTTGQCDSFRLLKSLSSQDMSKSHTQAFIPARHLTNPQLFSSLPKYRYLEKLTLLGLALGIWDKPSMANFVYQPLAILHFRWRNL